MPEQYFHDPRLQRLVDGPAAMLFDMNGFLVNDEGFHHDASNLVLKGLGLPPISEEEWTRFCIGRRLEETLPVIIAERNGHMEYSIVELVGRKEEYFNGLVRGRIREAARPGVLSFITYLAAAGKKRALVTSARMKDVELIAGHDGLDLLQYFNCIVTGEMIPERRGKPEPDPYLIGADRLGVYPAECVGFEDAYSGVESLRRAGMRSVAVPSRYTSGHDFSGATYVLDNLTRNARILHAL